MAYLPTLPRIRLVIVGAGHVGQAVAKLAARGRLRRLGRRRPPPVRQRRAVPHGAADRIVGPDRRGPARASRSTPQTYALIVTRGHGHDQEALYHLAATPAGYVGLIGSRRKIKLIFEGLREPGIAEAALARVAAPVGLDIGSETVPEIAVSIVAELIARRNLGPRLASLLGRTARRATTTPGSESRPGR